MSAVHEHAHGAQRQRVAEKASESQQAVGVVGQTQVGLPDCIIEIRDEAITAVYTRGQSMVWEVMDYDFKDLAPDDVWKAYLAQRSGFLDQNFNIRRDLFPKAGDKATPNTIPGMDSNNTPPYGDGATRDAAQLDAALEGILEGGTDEDV